MKRPALALVVLVSSVLTAGAGQDDDELSNEIWLYPDKAAAVTAAQLAAVGDPFAMAALRIEAFDQDVWDEPPLRLDRVPPLNRNRLAKVRDNVGFADFADKAPEEIPTDALAEDAVYWQAVAYSARVPREVFAKAAQANKHLTFGHLYTEPKKYRGAIVHFEGRLQRVKRLDPPLHARRKGIDVLYEGWIFLDQPGTHPICVIFPRLPASLAEGDKVNARVAFDGYFFKRYRYVSGRLDEDKNNVALDTVALIGPTVTVLGRSNAAAASVYGSQELLQWIFGFAGGVALLVVVMTWWFKRNDSKVKARLQAVRSKRFADVDPLPGNGIHTNGTPTDSAASKEEES